MSFVLVLDHWYLLVNLILIDDPYVLLTILIFEGERLMDAYDLSVKLLCLLNARVSHIQ